MFGRRKKDEPDLETAGDDGPDGDEAVEQVPPPPRPSGPWDQADAPEDAVNRIDLGGLLVPVPPETEVRVDVNNEGAVVAATLVRGSSSMQVNVFAAPRSYGIWSEVREEIGAALRQRGGQAADAAGRYGTELHAAVPAQAPGGATGLAPARFIGVDGPRWFLRAMLTGPAATDPAAAEPLETALRDIVVVRGSDPMAVRDPLPLKLPKQAQAQAEAQQVQAQQAQAQQAQAQQVQAQQAAAQQAAAQDQARTEQPSLQLPERGPEITERR